MRVEEVISQKALFDYTRNFPQIRYPFANLFPTRQVTDLEFDYIKGAYNRPAMAHFHAFDSETEQGQRYGYERNTAGLEFIKRRYRLNEKEIMKIRKPRTTQEMQFAIDYIYDDIGKLIQSIEVRVELMRAEVLSTGKLAINENGYKAQTVDFGVPTNHKGELTSWDDPDHDVLEDIYNIRKLMRDDSDAEIVPEWIITSEKWLYKILKNNVVRKSILGVNADQFITQAQLNENLRAMNLPQITTDDRRYAEETVKNGKLVRTNKRYFPEDCVLFLPSGTLGETVRGTTPEREELLAENSASVTVNNDITLTSWREVDPVAYHVKASSTAGISFPYAEDVYIGTAKDTD